MKLRNFFQVGKRDMVTFLKPSWRKAVIFASIFTINIIIILLAFTFGPETILIAFTFNFPVMFITSTIFPGVISLLLAAILCIPYWWLLSCFLSLRINKKTILVFSAFIIMLFIVRWCLLTISLPGMRWDLALKIEIQWTILIALMIGIPWLVFSSIFFIWDLLHLWVSKVVEEKSITLPQIKVGIPPTCAKIVEAISKRKIIKKFLNLDWRTYWLLDKAKSKKAAILFSYLSTSGLVIIALCIIADLFVVVLDLEHNFGGATVAAAIASGLVVYIIIRMIIILLIISIIVLSPLFILLFSFLDRFIFAYFSKTKQELSRFWAINSAISILIIGPLLFLLVILVAVDVISCVLHLPWAFSSPLVGMATLIFYIGLTAIYSLSPEGVAVGLSLIICLLIYFIFSCLVLKARTWYVLQREFGRWEFIKLNILWLLPLTAITVSGICWWLISIIMNIGMVGMIIVEIFRWLFTSFSFEGFLYLITLILCVPLFLTITSVIYLALYYLISIALLKILFSAWDKQGIAKIYLRFRGSKRR